MRNGLRMLIAIGVALVPVVVTPTPASAMTSGTATFMATLRLPPWGYVGIHPPMSGSIAFTSTTACSTAVGGKDIAAGLCYFDGAGNAFGNCGAASGTLWGSLYLINPLVSRTIITFHLNFQITGTTLLATGTAANGTQTGPITLASDFTPVLSIGGPSCATGTLTDFLATGNVTFTVI